MTHSPFARLYFAVSASYFSWEGRGISHHVRRSGSIRVQRHTTKQMHHWGSSLFLWATLGLILFWASTPVLLAHGGGTPRLTDVAAGPYRVFTWTQPEPLRVGEVHLTIGLTHDAAHAITATDSAMTQPVTDAAVIVRFTPRDGSMAPIEKSATLGGVGAVYYEVDASLLTAGSWQFMILVDGPDGEGVVEFEAELLAARTLNRTLLVGGGALFVLLVLLIALWNRRRPVGT